MIESVAIIGAGASGAAAAAALQGENFFKKIKVFERRGSAGGVWKFDPDPGNLPLKPGALPQVLDPPTELPTKLPCTARSSSRCRYETTAMYDSLVTNVPDVAMCFSDFPFPYGPFVKGHVPKQYIQQYLSLYRVDSFVNYNTTVEDLKRTSENRWRLILRTNDAARRVDEWWEEDFDAVVLANGHYSVPYIPPVNGLQEFIHKFPSAVQHSKMYRSAKSYRHQRVIVIGNSSSGRDITQQLLDCTEVTKPVYLSRRSKRSWEDHEMREDLIYKPPISEYTEDGTLVFQDGSTVDSVGTIIYCTGYKPSFPFWNSLVNGRMLYDYEENRLLNTYQHVLFSDFSNLAIVGFPLALTFRSFEYQAIAIARLWSNRNARPLPSPDAQKLWEARRIERCRKDGTAFHRIAWSSGECMEWLRWLFDFAGLPTLEGHGKYPPTFDEKTRWAIEHVTRYRIDDGCDRDSEGSTGWREAFERKEDALWFL